MLSENRISILISLLSALVGVVIYFTVFQQEPPRKKEIIYPGFQPHFGYGEDDYYRHDSIAGHIHRPNAKRDVAWAEHPSGRIVLATNNLGFKEDAPTQEAKAEGTYRILVAGDSHTDGVVYNHESYPNQLEALLNQQSGSITYEVINGGVGYHGPQNYLGLLQRYLYLKPDAFIVTIYTGNDYMDALRIAAENDGVEVPKRSEAYYAQLKKVDSIAPGINGQVTNQLLFFKTFPEQVSTALKLTKEALTTIKHLCDQNGIALLVVFLPTKADVELSKDEKRLNEAMRLLGFDEDEINTNQCITQQLEDWLRKEQITTLNLQPHLENNETELYWQKDFHLNHHGHKAVAELVLSVLSKKE